jgi:ribulose-5-phosphate 4-epimerase/fuculose-1-phosphate aldolase
MDWNGNLVSGDRPSKESPLHFAVYRYRSAAGAVIHLHSTFAAAVSCLDGLNSSSCIPPITPYFVMRVGRIPLIPYHRPGDSSLAAEVGNASARHAAILLANHGPVISGTDLDYALYAAEELEETAKLMLLLQGQPIRLLTPEQIAELSKHYGAVWT